MAGNYWTNVLSRRISRRRAIAATSATAFGATLLAACGTRGGANQKQDATALFTPPKDTSDRAIPGGILQTSNAMDVNPNFDVHKNATTPVQRATDFYDFVVKHSRGNGGGNGPIVGEAAESWEFSPDGLQLTLKMRANHTFDPRPPTSGRAMTAADVKFSWDRFTALSPQAADLLPTNPTSPIASLNAPDDKTVVVKLNFPYLSTLDILAYNQYMLIMPREVEGGFDPKTETRGAGPFYLEKWNTGQNLTWKKQPNWYEKGLPYLDGVVETIIPDRASTLSQFEAGNLWDGVGVRPEDVLGLKQAHPRMVLYQTFPSLSGNSCWQTSRQPGNIFNDVRARQAVSMLIDRDQYMEVAFGTDRFTAAGLPVVANWNSHIPSLNPEWLDPKKNQLGEGSKYFHLDVAEAKKLLAAAGYDGRTLSLQNSDRDDRNALDVVRGMLSQALTVETKVLPYEPTWRQTCQASQGTGYDGVCYNVGTGFNAEQHISRWYTPEGRYAYSKDETPVLTDLARKIRVEIDRNRQIELIKQFQRQAAVIQPLLMNIGTATGFNLHWPWLENFDVWTGFPSAHLKAYYWYNRAKDPKSS